MSRHLREGLTRRDFLRGTGMGTLGWGVAIAAGCSRESAEAPAQQDATPPGAETPAEPLARTAKVVIARDPQAITEDGSSVDDSRVRDLLSRALGELTGEDSLAAALGQYVKPSDKVGIKSNVMMLPIHDELLVALWEGLEQVGVPPGNVITWDRRNGLKGYIQGEDVAIDFDRDSVATVCSEFADVLVNMPGLKTHWLSGIGVCLKNWAGAVTGLSIRDENTPWPIHADSCADLGMLQAHPSIRDKARLCIVDGLQGLCHGGPQVNPQYVWNYAGLIVGDDAVAVDRVCLQVLQERRNEVRGEEWPVNPPPKHIQAAAEKYSLGEANIDRIEIAEV